MQPSHHNKMLSEPGFNLNPEMERCQRILGLPPIFVFLTPECFYLG